MINEKSIKKFHNYYNMARLTAATTVLSLLAIKKV